MQDRQTPPRGVSRRWQTRWPWCCTLFDSARRTVSHEIIFSKIYGSFPRPGSLLSTVNPLWHLGLRDVYARSATASNQRHGQPRCPVHHPPECPHPVQHDVRGGQHTTNGTSDSSNSFLLFDVLYTSSPPLSHINVHPSYTGTKHVLVLNLYSH